MFGGGVKCPGVLDPFESVGIVEDFGEGGVVFGCVSRTELVE
jgi:hypothetical protein